MKVRGYEVVRKDRRREGGGRWSRGGGLVTLVREGWSYEVLPCDVSGNESMEVLKVRVLDEQRREWRICNVYAPVNSASVDKSEWRRLPGNVRGAWIIAGDFNAHHPEWDQVVDGDARGERLM